jgi:uracil-DNA glycosylase
VSKWMRLLRVYEEVETDDFWEHLRQPGIRLVRGDGIASAEVARVLVVGEAPGASENGSGKPFVGASGLVLNQLLDLAEFTRETVFVTNVVKYRPPGNRTPTVGEEIHAAEALRREYAIIRPTLVVLVGATAHGAMHPNRGVMSVSQCYPGGPPQMYHDGTYVKSMYHPAYGLRNPKMQPKMEEHWERLGAWCREYLPEVHNVALP